MMKILVAGMGNLLRGDDGFGIRVIEELANNHRVPKGVDLYEAGTAGIALVQELMNGYDAIIAVDAVEKGAVAGTLFVLEPLENEPPIEDGRLHATMGDMHYADPSKVFLLARALKVCPPRVFVVPC